MSWKESALVLPHVFGEKPRTHQSLKRGGKTSFGLEIHAISTVLMCLCSLTLPCSENCIAVLSGEICHSSPSCCGG